MTEDMRDRLTGESFGLYFLVRCSRDKTPHQIYLYASRFEVTDGDLVLFSKDDKTYRAFSRGNWQEIASASCMDGSEMYEEHDYVETKGKIK
jgi:hypothetical protein